MQVSFKANFISDTQINKIKRNAQTEPLNVSFVEFKPNRNDIAALNEFYNEIVYKPLSNVKYFSVNDWINPNKNKVNHIYGVTTQKKFFGYVKPKTILGVVETLESTDLNSLSIIDIKLNPVAEKTLNPEKHWFDLITFGLFEQKQQYSDVKKAVIDSLKNVSQKLIVCSSIKDIPFFEQNGFKNNSIYSKKILEWKK